MSFTLPLKQTPTGYNHFEELINEDWNSYKIPPRLRNRTTLAQALALSGNKQIYDFEVNTKSR